MPHIDIYIVQIYTLSFKTQFKSRRYRIRVRIRQSTSPNRIAHRRRQQSHYPGTSICAAAAATLQRIRQPAAIAYLQLHILAARQYRQSSAFSLSRSTAAACIQHCRLQHISNYNYAAATGPRQQYRTDCSHPLSLTRRRTQQLHIDTQRNTTPATQH